MMFSRIIVLTVFFFTQSVLYSTEPEIVLSKIFPLDSAVFTSSKIIKCSDGNILLNAWIQKSYYNPEWFIQNIKLNQSGDLIWNNLKSMDTRFAVSDIFEIDNNYFNAASTTLKIGKYDETVQSVFKIDINGNDVYHKVDSFSNTSKFKPLNTKKFNDKLISFYNGTTSSNPFFTWLYYDLEGNYLSYKNIDTLYIANLLELWGVKVSINYDNSILYSFSTVSNNNNFSPLYYLVYNNTGESEKEFIFNQEVLTITSSRTGPAIKLRNGDFLLSGRIHLMNNDKLDFVRRVNSDGNLLWEDTLKNELVIFNKIVEDDFGNIIIAGHKINKPHPIVTSSFINYFYLSCYESNGQNKFKKVWGDSTIDNQLDDLIITEDNNIIAVGSFADMPYFAKISYNPTSVNDLDIKSGSLFLNPNPVRDIFTIEGYNGDLKDLIQIFNLHGIKVFETEFNENLDVGNLLSGVYILKIGNFYQKFVKL